MPATTPKPPKRSIAKMHELLGSALGLWQSDVRDWAITTKAEWETDTMQNDLFTMHEWLRQWWVEVEGNNAPDATVRAGGKIDAAGDRPHE